MSNMEHFTQRARHVLALAESAASQFNQPLVGTEHLLLGLLREGSGLASQVLRHLGLDQKRMVDLISELGLKPEPSPNHRSPERSPEVHQVMSLAIEEAQALNQRYIGTEHLLLGLVRQEDSIALRILRRFDILPAQIREQTIHLAQQEEAAPKAEIAEDSSDDSEPTHSPDMTMAIVTRLLDMVSENKLSSMQASELLRALPLDLTLTATGKAAFASMVNRSGLNVKRRVRVIVSDSASKQTLFELVNPLDAMLAFVDHFLRLVADNDFESLVLDGDSSPIITELRLEDDEAGVS